MKLSTRKKMCTFVSLGLGLSLALLSGAVALSQQPAAKPLPFYAKGPGNESYVKNLEVLAFDNLVGGAFFQTALYKTEKGKYYIYGTMGDAVGIVDVTDAQHPRFVRRYQTIDRKIYPTSRNPKIQIADGLMIVAMSSGGGPQPTAVPEEQKSKAKSLNGVCIYNIKDDPENPKFLSYWDNGVPFANGVHRFMYDGGRYVHLSADARSFEGMIYRILDIKDPLKPVEIGRWWMPDQYADGYPDRTFDPGAQHNPTFMDKNHLHGPPFVIGDKAYLGYSGAGLVILDVSDFTRPKCLGELKFMPPFSSQLAGSRTHTALPLPGRNYVVVTNEGERYTWFTTERIKKNNRVQALNNIHMVDVSDPRNPTLVAEFPYPEVPEGFPFKNFNEAWLGVQGPFGPHNLHEPMPGKPWLESRADRVYCAYFAAGLRVYDVSDPYYIKEIAYFIPPNPLEFRGSVLPGPLMTITEDIVVDERGFIYLNCSNDGMYILKMKK